MYRGELFNSISHLVASALVLVAASVLITLAAVEGHTVKIVSYTIYSVTLFFLYLCSTLFHSLQGRAKRIFQKLDHIAIYLLIAGTYTPFALLALEGSAGWWLLGAVWSLACIGVVSDSFAETGPRAIPIIIYLIMGWSCVFALDGLIQGMSNVAFSFLVAGGITYTIGVIFFILDNWLPWCHEIWHLFVIVGSVCHYIAIFLL